MNQMLHISLCLWKKYRMVVKKEPTGDKERRDCMTKIFCDVNSNETSEQSRLLEWLDNYNVFDGHSFCETLRKFDSVEVEDM